MRFLLLLTSAALGVIPASSASADCRTTPFRFMLGQSQTTEASSETDGKTCHEQFRAGGRTTFTSASTVKRPRHGTLTQPGNFHFAYKPNSGFAGDDDYTVKICGTGLSGPGCAAIHYTVAVK